MLMLNGRLIGIPLLERRVGLEYAGQRFWGSITINDPKLLTTFAAVLNQKTSALLQYQCCCQHICLCRGWYTYKFEQMDVIPFEMYILRVGHLS